MTSSSPAVGIDLGTTFSVIAHIAADGRPQTIPNAEGALLTPSVVLFDEDSHVVGEEAKKAAPLLPDRVADFVKRDVGNSVYHRTINGQQIPPEEIQALILEKLKQDAERIIGPIDAAVITVPSFYKNNHRRSTQNSGKLAGLEVLDIINEPTAAGLLYGLQSGFMDRYGQARETERILVYDLGGGTFDCTIMEVDPDGCRVLASEGEITLGGRDWDLRIADRIAEEFSRQNRGIDVKSDPAGNQRLLEQAVQVKQSLTVREQTLVGFEHAGNSVEVTFCREEIERLTEDLLERTIQSVDDARESQRLEWSDLTRVLLVGGSTRMPGVARRLETLTGLNVDRLLSPDEAIAQGAALHAESLLIAQDSGRVKNTSNTAVGVPVEPRRPSRFQDVSSHNLGVIARDPKQDRLTYSQIIPKNTPLPVFGEKKYKTSVEDQRKLSVRLVEGPDFSEPTGDDTLVLPGQSGAGLDLDSVASLIQMFEVEVPPRLPRGTALFIAIEIESNGRIGVRVRVPDGGVDVTQEVSR